MHLRLTTSRNGNRWSLRRWWPRATSPSQRSALLRLVTVATEEHLPLAPLLEAWATDERGVQQSRVRRLVALLRKGRSLPDAAEEVPGALGDSAVLAIRFGAQSGALATALHDAQRDAAALQASPVRRWTLTYFLIISLLFALIISFIYIKIIPSMVEILKDFGMTQPAALRLSIDAANFVQRFWWVFVSLGLLVAWSAVSARPGRLLRLTLLGKLFQPLRNLRSAEVLEKLGLAAAAGRPVTGAISTLARYHFDPATRRTLLFVRNEVEQGADLWKSLASGGLLTAPEEQLLKTADRVGNRTWMLQQLAARKKQRTLRKLDRLSELLLPALVTLLGLFVLSQALTILLPLVLIIKNLA